jgi:hypothetical protein
MKREENASRERIAAIEARQKLVVERAKAEADQTLAILEAEMDRLAQQSEHRHELAMERSDQQHELKMAEKDREADTEKQLVGSMLKRPERPKEAPSEKK